MPEIVWQDPPPEKPRHLRARDPRRVAMDANPGKWLLWGAQLHPSITTRLKRDGYEAVARAESAGQRYDIYARRPEGWTAP